MQALVPNLATAPLEPQLKLVSFRDWVRDGFARSFIMNPVQFDFGFFQRSLAKEKV